MKFTLLIASLILSANVFAGDVAAGKQKAASCAACHGGNGISTNPIWPNLAGQKAPYIVSQLKAFKSGERKNAIMAGMAGALSEADMENLAAYYASLK
jgi:cytochrome c553